MRKVLHLNSERGFRGGERQLAYLVAELNRMDVESIVVAKKGSKLEQYCQRENIKHYTASFFNALDFISAIKVKRICAKEGIELIHLHTSKAHSVGVLAAVFGNKIPMVLSRKVNFAPKQTIFTRWKYNFKDIKRIIGVSQAVTDTMKGYVNDPSQCVTVYDGIDLNRFGQDVVSGGNILRDTYSIDRGIKLVGNTTALSDSKDLFTFINTMEVLYREGLPVHGFIIGDGECRSDLEAFVKKKGLEKAITFTGYKSPVEPYLYALDIFMITSKEEGLGSSILDAFVAGVPVVGTRAGGIPELVVHGQTGLVADVADAKGLADNIKQILSDRSFSDTVVSNAHEWVKGFSKENFAKLTFQIYLNVLSTQ